VRNVPSSSSYLNTKVTAVHVIAQEEVARVSRIATDFKQLHEIVVLSVNITTHSNGRVHLQHIWLGLEDLCTLPYDP
jgi:hypothetical protein